MDQRDPEEIRKMVRERYGGLASCGSAACADQEPTCCAAPTIRVEDLARKMGYSWEETSGAPDGANMGLGCGNPSAIAALKPGEVVLDLGAGGGFDCFLAAKQVGEAGQVIGVDMTPEMLSKARENARKGGYTNVEFRLGEVEHLPAADQSVDVIISNCVINLSPDKPAVYREAFRVLRPGGRLAISDVVLKAPLPETLRHDLQLLAGCVAGAVTVETIREMLEMAGFREIRIQTAEGSRDLIRQWVPGLGLENYISSGTIEAVKPEVLGS